MTKNKHISKGTCITLSCYLKKSGPCFQDLNRPLLLCTHHCSYSGCFRIDRPDCCCAVRWLWCGLRVNIQLFSSIKCFYTSSQLGPWPRNFLAVLVHNFHRNSHITVEFRKIWGIVALIRDTVCKEKYEIPLKRKWVLSWPFKHPLRVWSFNSGLLVLKKKQKKKTEWRVLSSNPSLKCWVSNTVMQLSLRSTFKFSGTHRGANDTAWVQGDRIISREMKFYSRTSLFFFFPCFAPRKFT